MIWVYSKLSDGEVNYGCTYLWSNRFEPIDPNNVHGQISLP